MNKYLYPLVATGLISVAPFLLTFEKGQDLVHGLFNFSVLGLMLLFVNVRRIQGKFRIVLLVLVALLTILISYQDLQNILEYKHAEIGWYWIIPIVSVGVALVLLKEAKPISLYSISFILFVSMGVSVVADKLYPSQPLFEAPVIKALSRYTESPTKRVDLSESVRERYNATDSILITRNFIDSSRSNVMILVESWGVPVDSNLFNKELSLFKNATYKGMHPRMYSQTRTAEREDLLDSIHRNESGKRDSFFLPQKLKNDGYRTIFLFGGNSEIQQRDRYIGKLGFEDIHFSDQVILDSVMVHKVDSLLSESSEKKLIVWTTHDTQFPMGNDVASIEKRYIGKMFNTLERIALLATKHPEIRFIVQGDHEPILSPQEFRQKFYRRWVPYVVLN